MAGYFAVGETKTRPGAYFNVQSNGSGDSYGAIDGIVAVLFKSNMGPLNKAQILEAGDGYESVYGTGGTTDAIREALYGGARQILAVRVGSGGTAAKLDITVGDNKKVTITAKYAGAASYKATVRAKLGDSEKKECIIYLDSAEFEKVTFPADSTDEVAGFVSAFASSKNFDVTAETGAAGVIPIASQSAFTAGTDPTTAAADYTNALKEVEKHYFNTICIDTEDTQIQALVAAFLDRIYEEGNFGMAVFAQASTVALATRVAAAAAYNSEKVVFVVNAKAQAGDLELGGYQIAAYVAGVIASTAANQSVTHTVTRYTELLDALTNSEIENAEQNGCLVLSTSTDGSVWLDNGINTLVAPDAEHDNGWKKIRRTKTRYELMFRANAAADALVGRVNNDVNGRATIASAVQAVCNAMVNEGKIQYALVEESTSNVADGDACWFDIDVIDLDSAEHIYLTYNFRFSTVMA